MEGPRDSSINCNLKMQNSSYSLLVHASNNIDLTNDGIKPSCSLVDSNYDSGIPGDSKNK